MKVKIWTALFAIIVASAAFEGQSDAQEIKHVNTVSGPATATSVKKLTVNLYAENVEACVEFWVRRLHFEKTMEVKAGDGLAFAALRKDGIELMYGSYASLESDPATAKVYKRGTSTLFIEVEDVNATLLAMKGAPLISDLHKTFYGSSEFTVTDPAGHLLTFAQMQDR